MRDPLVSIIIPCFNGARYIGEAIESALAQTYPHKEVIVIDDGSTDDSLGVIRSFGDAIRWETRPNQGGGAARNRGMQLARGELIQFLDADDLLNPEKLERQVPVAISRNPAVVYSDYSVVQLDGSVVPEIKGRDSVGRDSVVFVLATPRLSIAAPLHWKSMVHSIRGFRKDLNGSQERDLHLRLAANGAMFHHLPEALYTVRTLPGSVSSDYVRAVAEQLRILPPVVAELSQRGCLTDERARAFAESFARSGRACLQRGAYGIGRLLLAEAAKMHPSAGIEGAYSWRTRWLQRLAGPVATELLAQGKRRAVALLTKRSTAVY